MARTLQQQLSAHPSRTVASFIQEGGKSSSLTASNGLKILKLWRRSGAVQNETTVSRGGQPGSPQATSATSTAQSAGSPNLSRVQLMMRSTADERSGVRFDRLIVIARRRYGGRAVEVNWCSKRRLEARKN